MKGMSGCHFTPTRYASASASTKLGSASSANAPALTALSVLVFALYAVSTPSGIATARAMICA